jgi:restriction endonuclease
MAKAHFTEKWEVFADFPESVKIPCPLCGVYLPDFERLIVDLTIRVVSSFLQSH